MPYSPVSYVTVPFATVPYAAALCATVLHRCTVCHVCRPLYFVLLYDVRLYCTPWWQLVWSNNGCFCKSDKPSIIIIIINNGCLLYVHMLAAALACMQRCLSSRAPTAGLPFQFPAADLFHFLPLSLRPSPDLPWFSLCLSCTVMCLPLPLSLCPFLPCRGVREALIGTAGIAAGRCRGGGGGQGGDERHSR